MGRSNKKEREHKKGKKNMNDFVKPSNPSLLSVKVLSLNVRSLKNIMQM